MINNHNDIPSGIPNQSTLQDNIPPMSQENLDPLFPQVQYDPTLNVNPNSFDQNNNILLENIDEQELQNFFMKYLDDNKVSQDQENNYSSKTITEGERSFPRREKTITGNEDLADNEYHSWKENQEGHDSSTSDAVIDSTSNIESDVSINKRPYVIAQIIQDAREKKYYLDERRIREDWENSGWPLAYSKHEYRLHFDLEFNKEYYWKEDTRRKVIQGSLRNGFQDRIKGKWIKWPIDPWRIEIVQLKAIFEANAQSLFNAMEKGWFRDDFNKDYAGLHQPAPEGQRPRIIDMGAEESRRLIIDQLKPYFKDSYHWELYFSQSKKVDLRDHSNKDIITGLGIKCCTKNRPKSPSRGKEKSISQLNNQSNFISPNLDSVASFSTSKSSSKSGRSRNTSSDREVGSTRSKSPGVLQSLTKFRLTRAESNSQKFRASVNEHRSINPSDTSVSDVSSSSISGLYDSTKNSTDDEDLALNRHVVDTEMTDKSQIRSLVQETVLKRTAESGIWGWDAEEEENFLKDSYSLLLQDFMTRIKTKVSQINISEPEEEDSLSYKLQAELVNQNQKPQRESVPAYNCTISPFFFPCGICKKNCACSTRFVDDLKTNEVLKGKSQRNHRLTCKGDIARRIVLTSLASTCFGDLRCILPFQAQVNYINRSIYKISALGTAINDFPDWIREGVYSSLIFLASFGRSGFSGEELYQVILQSTSIRLKLSRLYSRSNMVHGDPGTIDSLTVVQIALIQSLTDVCSESSSDINKFIDLVLQELLLLCMMLASPLFTTHWDLNFCVPEHSLEGRNEFLRRRIERKERKQIHKIIVDRSISISVNLFTIFDNESWNHHQGSPCKTWKYILRRLVGLFTIATSSNSNNEKIENGEVLEPLCYGDLVWLDFINSIYGHGQSLPIKDSAEDANDWVKVTEASLEKSKNKIAGLPTYVYIKKTMPISNVHVELMNSLNGSDSAFFKVLPL